MNDSDKSKIDNLKQILYSRKVKIKPNFVLDLHGHKSEVNDKWASEGSSNGPIELAGSEEPDSSHISKRIFWVAFIFFVLSALFAGYVYFRGSNLISSNNIKIDVIGPTSIKAGEETTLDIAITNNNDTALNIADLVLEFPKGTRQADDKLTLMERNRIAFDDIGPHETVRRTIKSIIYGEENSLAQINMTLEYRIDSAMSVFTKDSVYEVVVGSSPLTISVNGLKEVNANQDYELKVQVVSNSTETVRDAVVVGEMPIGFEIGSVLPATIPKTTIWSLGDIEPGGKREISIKGKMYGDHNDERYFKFNVGTKDIKNETQISGIIASVKSAVQIREPFIGVGLYFAKSGDSTATNFIARTGTTISGSVELSNNLDVPVSDVSVEMKVNGEVVTPNSIKAAQGFFDSNVNIVRWNRFYNQDLATMLPKNKNILNFSFLTMKSNAKELSRLTNPQFTIDITVRAKRRLESGVPEEIISTIKRTIKIESEPHLIETITHSTGPIENEGTIPPKVGQKTEYTVIWTVTNNFNQLSNTMVKAVLPDYVDWTGVVVSNGEKISYNKDSREILWDLGTVSSQVNGVLTLRQVAFQISFVPSSSQVQSTPVLLNLANFVARDTFTNTNITGSGYELTTELPTDPMFVYENAQVIQ